MNFSVPIGEREPARAIMHRPWNIAPLSSIGAIDEKAVVARIGVFIKRHPSHRRLPYIGLLEELPIGRVEPGPAVAVIGRFGPAPAEQGIHGITPQARSPTPGFLLRAKKV